MDSFDAETRCLFAHPHEKWLLVRIVVAKITDYEFNLQFLAIVWNTKLKYIILFPHEL